MQPVQCLLMIQDFGNCYCRSIREICGAALHSPTYLSQAKACGYDPVRSEDPRVA